MLRGLVFSLKKSGWLYCYWRVIRGFWCSEMVWSFGAVWVSLKEFGGVWGSLEDLGKFGRI